MHDTPPLDAGVDDVKVRVWLPPPHVLEQVPQPLHEPTQLPGQAEVEQDCDWVLPLSPP